MTAWPRRPGCPRACAQTLPAPAGFFTSRTRRLRSPDRDPLRTAEGGGEALQARDDRVGRGAERVGERRRRERVVDVVEPGRRSSHSHAHRREREREARPVEPVERDAPRRDVEWRARMTAARAAVVAEMPDVGGCVHVRGAATDAVLESAGNAGAHVPAAGHPRRSATRCRGPRRASRPAGRPRSRRRRWTRGDRRPRGASAPPPAPPRRNDRAGRENKFPETDRTGLQALHDLGEMYLSSSNSPSCAPGGAATSADTTPETRFAPARLCARTSGGDRISATIAAVVVLPFVAETTALPSGSRAPSRSSAPGSSRHRSFPGSVVPPRPRRHGRRDRRAAQQRAPEAQGKDASRGERTGEPRQREPASETPGRAGFRSAAGLAWSLVGASAQPRSMSSRPVDAESNTPTATTRSGAAAHTPSPWMGSSSPSGEGGLSRTATLYFFPDRWHSLRASAVYLAAPEHGSHPWGTPPPFAAAALTQLFRWSGRRATSRTTPRWSSCSRRC